MEWDNENMSCALEREALKYGTKELLKFNKETTYRLTFQVQILNYFLSGSLLESMVKLCIEFCISY